jgi:putative peptide zinc metalloprotease protein
VDFAALNLGHGLIAYRQAVLWDGKVAALSGAANVEANSPYVLWLDKLFGAVTVVAPTPFSAAEVPEAVRTQWAEWLPPHAAFLPAGDAVLLFAREEPFKPEELALLERLADLAGMARKALTPKRLKLPIPQGRRKWMLAAAILLVLLFPVTGSVLAPAESVPAHPVIVRAPLDGVVDNIAVQPNQAVKEGDTLFALDATTLSGRLDVARQQHATAEAEYRQAAQAMVFDSKAKAQVAILAGKAEEKAAEARLLESQLARITAKAPKAGIAVFDDVSDWIGRPVVGGEKVMAVADETDTEVEAWVSVADVGEVKIGGPLTLFLNTAPLSPRKAKVRSIACEASARPDSTIAHRVRATLADGEDKPRLGLKGIARIDGDTVPLVWWAFRRPLATIRQFVGFSAMLAAALPPLRDDLAVLPGPAAHDGGPTWTLHDPLANRYFRLSWPAFEILSRWHLGEAQSVAESVESETVLEVGAEDVGEVVEFLARGGLLKTETGKDVDRLLAIHDAAKTGWLTWLLHHISVLPGAAGAPRRAAGQGPSVRRLDGRPGVSPRHLGGLAFRHDHGHAPVGKLRRHLCRSFFPQRSGHLRNRPGFRQGLSRTESCLHRQILWLPGADHGGGLPGAVAHALHRRQRRLEADRPPTAPDGGWRAGILAEMTIAAWAVLAWGLLPDGPAKGIAFTLAVTTLISSLAINLSPFMRFDGYFLAMDALDQPNLHPRSFALARWHLREMLFDLGEPVPENLPAATRAWMIVFAWAVWIYRLALFFGIAVLVYHFFIKVVGVVLFVVEMGWFVLRPFLGEFGEWRKRGAAIRASQRTRWPLGFGLAALLLLIVPWSGRVSAPAILKADQHVAIYAPSAAVLEAVTESEGQMVEAGTVLANLDNPDSRHRLEQVERRIGVLKYELSAIGFDETFRSRSQAITEELAAALAEKTALSADLARLRLVAPIGGTITDVSPMLQPGQWINSREAILGIRSGAQVEAYVAEADLPRIAIGASAAFISENGGAPITAAIAAIDRVAVKSLTEPALATQYGGAIPARFSDKTLVPDHALYRVRLTLAQAQEVAAPVRGQVHMEGERQSLMGTALRSATAVLIREWGF